MSTAIANQFHLLRDLYCLPRWCCWCLGGVGGGGHRLGTSPACSRWWTMRRSIKRLYYNPYARWRQYYPSSGRYYYYTEETQPFNKAVAAVVAAAHLHVDGGVEWNHQRYRWGRQFAAPAAAPPPRIWSSICSGHVGRQENIIRWPCTRWGEVR